MRRRIGVSTKLGQRTGRVFAGRWRGLRAGFDGAFDTVAAETEQAAAFAAGKPPRPAAAPWAKPRSSIGQS